MKWNRLLACLALLLTLPCLADPKSDEDLFRDAVRANTLTAAQVNDLEQQIIEHPDDVDSRARWLGYYLFHHADSDAIAATRRGYVLWMIQNQPENRFTGSPFCECEQNDLKGEAQCAALWLKQVETFPKSAKVLGNAADFFRLRDPARAESLFGQAELVDAKNPRWPDQLASLYLLMATGRASTTQSAHVRQDRARQAVAELQKALALTSEKVQRFYLISRFPRAEFEAGDMDAAEKYARLSLEQAAHFPHDWNYGNAIYDGNLYLGRVALESGDVESAKKYLLAAAATPGSPQLGSFGPNVTLARDLLAKGEKQTVLDYLDRCSIFWHMGEKRLKQWKVAIASGKTPDWSSNLNY